MLDSLKTENKLANLITMKTELVDRMFKISDHRFHEIDHARRWHRTSPPPGTKLKILPEKADPGEKWIDF